MARDDFKALVASWIDGQYASRQEAERRTARFRDVYDLLGEGIVHFWFRKRDGSLRSAYGTLVMEIVARHGGVPDGEQQKDRTFSGTLLYFDLEKDAWRCFKADSVQEIDFEYGAM